MTLLLRTEPRGSGARSVRPCSCPSSSDRGNGSLPRCAFACILVPAPGGRARAAEPRRLRLPMRAKITAAQTENRMVCRGELVCGIAELPRILRPAGVSGGVDAMTAGRLRRPKASFARIEAAGEDGLAPQSYHLETIRQLLAKVRLEDGSGRQPDPALSVGPGLPADGCLLDCWAPTCGPGRVNPETFSNEWVVQHRPGGRSRRILDARHRIRSHRRGPRWAPPASPRNTTP
ncbi:MAG: hypothetical protein MZV70_56055 [Desulfobacterales bacterium]|nr:hypothetical protein [Desulfobacterales bacterium]